MLRDRSTWIENSEPDHRLLLLVLVAAYLTADDSDGPYFSGSS